MFDDENAMKRDSIESQIRCLQADLSANTSDIGDWKIAKITEYQLLGKEAPYDLEELNIKRQAARDKINELQAQLEELDS